MTMPTITLDPRDAKYIAESDADASCKPRILVERVICRRLVQALLAAGYYVTVDNEGYGGSSDDAEDYAIASSRDEQAIMDAIMAVDDEYLLVSRDGDLFDPVKRGTETDFVFDSYVQLVYGNDGWDVISDYQTDLENVLKPVNDFAETLDGGALFLVPDAEALAALHDLVNLFDATGVVRMPAFAGMNTEPADRARRIVADRANGITGAVRQTRAMKRAADLLLKVLEIYAGTEPVAPFGQPGVIEDDRKQLSGADVVECLGEIEIPIRMAIRDLGGEEPPERDVTLLEAFIKARYECKWGEGYSPNMGEITTQEVGIEFFGPENGYTDADRAKIAALRVGDDADLSDSSGQHWVRRIA